MQKRQKRAPAGRYGEYKARTTLMLTATAKSSLQSQSEDLGISLSELVERMARGLNSTELTAESVGE